MTPRRRSITTLAKTTKFPSNTHHCTRRRSVDHPLTSRIHIRNTFIYHIFNVSPGTGNSGSAGAAWLGSGHDGHDDLTRWGHDTLTNRSGHVPHKVGGNLLVESLLFRTLLRGSALLSCLWVQLREGNVVHGGALGARLDGTTELTNSLLLSVDAILLGNLHHLILLVETALARTELEITRLVYGYEYWSHCLVYTEKMFKGEFRLLYI